ncbi:hypothetical protein ATCV1_z422R [Acanthocystis turfacea chlorella virus 1]|uniref:Uncharacterized protein z422R n=1 Tax=Chlorovirus heliozoae TaxID=322019 RepID=A7K932_9PHYC|nr:hypothetical protein ATCV1_z422R [Acanthocystis turfacea chlorella virus 1]ABT16556.1 hypothetical protein ATCV1_z422R [Acanthocystis turfacea chlorella virus 1]
MGVFSFFHGLHSGTHSKRRLYIYSVVSRQLDTSFPRSTVSKNSFMKKGACPFLLPDTVTSLCAMTSSKFSTLVGWSFTDIKTPLGNLTPGHLWQETEMESKSLYWSYPGRRKGITNPKKAASAWMYTSSFPASANFMRSTSSTAPRKVDPMFARIMAGLAWSTRHPSFLVSNSPVSVVGTTTESILRMFAIFLME